MDTHGTNPTGDERGSGAPRGGCPDPETLAAFVDRRLEPGRRAGVADHIAGCDDCLFVVGETSAFLDDPPATVHPRPRRRWLAPAAGLLAGAALALIAIRFGGSPSPTPAPVVAEHAAAGPASADTRSLAVADWRQSHLGPLLSVMTVRPASGRFGSLPYLPRRRVTRSASAAVPPEVLAAVAQVEAGTSARGDWQSLWARGLALAARGDFEAAMAALESVRPPADPPGLANDLLADRAAACIGRTERTGEAAWAQRALGLSDQLLARDPASLPGRFNRAIALDQLDRGDAAHRAWQDYLARDAHSPWAGDARELSQP